MKKGVMGYPSRSGLLG